jgi:hypothetical protein
MTSSASGNAPGWTMSSRSATSPRPPRAAAHAQVELAEAKLALAKAGAGDEPDDAAAASAAAAVEAARAQVATAEAGLKACYSSIILTAMPPDDFEMLMAKHPPRPDADDKRYNAETFPKACFLACATQMPPEQWEEILRDNLSYAERDDLYLLAVAANERLINTALPKGSTPTRS